MRQENKQNMRINIELYEVTDGVWLCDITDNANGETYSTYLLDGVNT